MSAVVNIVLARPSQVLVIRAISVSVWSTMAKFQARQFSALMAPICWPLTMHREVDLADGVLLDDLADRLAVRALHDHLGLDELRGPGEQQVRLPVRVPDLQLVRHELVEAGDEPQRPS